LLTSLLFCAHLLLHDVLAAGCVALACIFIAIALPETKGLTSQGISAAFEAHRLWGPVIASGKAKRAAADKAAAPEKV
jgi:hypothetical protein